MCDISGVTINRGEIDVENVGPLVCCLGNRVR